MDGTLEPEETPGGGLTMIISLPAPAAASQPTAAPGLRERDGTADGVASPVTRHGPGIAAAHGAAPDGAAEEGAG